MFLSDFDYDLPDELIARFPASERRASRLLVLGDDLQDRNFVDFPRLVEAGDLLVFNDTRVIPARLFGQKQTGGKGEILIERITSENEALAQIRASKSPKPDSTIELDGDCTALVLGREGNLFRLGFSSPVAAFLDEFGSVPLPPYIDRNPDSADVERYQTVYAREPGAVAAPTAGLHFDEQMLTETRSAGVRHAFVTLHVGAGTFQPLREENLAANRLHAERLSVNSEVADAVRETRASGGRVIAVGTTSVRALEAASTGGEIDAFDGETELFIRSGYDFRSVDAMLTNFHLPKSSLLMLVAAFAGFERTMSAYRHAVSQQYRFFSYGDAMLVYPAH
jgi:S-adenosylmethionine:tRNA ribosyltransferase-isomerase